VFAKNIYTMKKLFFASLILISAFSVRSQNAALKFGGGLNLGIPVHNLSGSTVAIGADFLAHYAVTTQVAITGDFGYTALFAENGGATTNILPLRAGLRVYPAENVYFLGKIGAGFISSNGSSVTSTAYSLGGGYSINNKLEIGASYDGYSKNGTIGLLNLRLGFFFK